MRTIYLDNEFKCHLEPVNSESISVELDEFDDKSAEYVMAHRYIPEGYSWRGQYGPLLYKWDDTYQEYSDTVPMMASVFAAEPEQSKVLNIADLSIHGAEIDVSNLRPYASGEVGATMHVAFDDYWNNLDIYATFVASDVHTEEKVVGSTINVPAIVLKKAYVSLEVGFCGYSSPDHERVMTTKMHIFKRTPKGASCFGESPDDPRHDRFEDLVKNLGDVSALKTECKDNVVCAINEVFDNVGKTNNQVFDTVEEMNTWLETHSSELNVGDNLYIRDTNVPDYWWDGTKAQILETEKVDLSGYYTSEQVDTKLKQKANTTDIPTKNSQLENDSGFVTNQIDDSEVSKDSTHSSAKNNQDFANALVRTVQGEVIAVDDVSPLEHDVECKVERLNWLNLPQKYTIKEIVEKDMIIPAGKYTLQFGAIENLGSTAPVIVFFWDGGEKDIALYQDFPSRSINFPTDCYKIVCYSCGYDASTSTNWTVTVNNVQLLKGTPEKGQPYTPYIPDLSKVTVSRCGRNLFDKSASVPGFPDTNTGVIKPDRYGRIVSDYIPYNPNARYHLNYYNVNNYHAFYDKDKNFLAVKNTEPNGVLRQVPSAAFVRINVFEKQADAVQLEVGDKETAYEPYNCDSFSSSAEGIVSGMTSLSPNMTILTDTPGVQLTVQYNRDSNAAYAELMELIKNLQNNAVQ